MRRGLHGDLQGTAGPSTVFLEIDYRWRQKYAGMPPAMAKQLTLTTPTIDLILGDRLWCCMDGD